MIDLPMPIIVENFANYYNHLQARSKFPKKLRRRVLPVEAPRLRKTPQFTIQQTVNSAATLALMTTKLGNMGGPSSIAHDSSATLIMKEPKKIFAYDNKLMQATSKSKSGDKPITSL